MQYRVLLMKMRQKTRIILSLVFFAIAAADARGAERADIPGVFAPLGEWLEQETATGGWNGYREKLKEGGISISSNFTADINGNPVGGIKRRCTYAGFLDLCVGLDLEKIAGLKGMALTVSNFLASGNNLSNSVGDFFGVQEIYTSGNYFFGELDLSWSLMDDTLTLEAGRLFAGDVFAKSEFGQYYVNGGINDNLTSLTANTFFPHYNIAAWAVRAGYQPNDNWHCVAGMYNADPGVDRIEKHGADFSFNMYNGYMGIGQITYSHGHEQDGNGLPGSTTFGSYYQSSRFQDLEDQTKRWHGNHGYYVVFDQMIYRADGPSGVRRSRRPATYAEEAKKPYKRRDAKSPDRPKGLSVWAAGYLAPNKNINPQRYQITGGLVYQGLPPGRDRDVTAFCVIMGKFSDKLEGQGTETVLEVNHRFQLGPWFYITPDIQYVIRPSGSNDIDDALVIGFEVSTNF